MIDFDYAEGADFYGLIAIAIAFALVVFGKWKSGK